MSFNKDNIASELLEHANKDVSGKIVISSNSNILPAVRDEATTTNPSSCAPAVSTECNKKEEDEKDIEIIGCFIKSGVANNEESFENWHQAVPQVNESSERTEGRDIGNASPVLCLDIALDDDDCGESKSSLDNNQNSDLILIYDSSHNQKTEGVVKELPTDFQENTQTSNKKETEYSGLLGNKCESQYLKEPSMPCKRRNSDKTHTRSNNEIKKGNNRIQKIPRRKRLSECSASPDSKINRTANFAYGSSQKFNLTADSHKSRDKRNISLSNSSDSDIQEVDESKSCFTIRPERFSLDYAPFDKILSNNSESLNSKMTSLRNSEPQREVPPDKPQTYFFQYSNSRDLTSKFHELQEDATERTHHLSNYFGFSSSEKQHSIEDKGNDVRLFRSLRYNSNAKIEGTEENENVPKFGFKRNFNKFDESSTSTNVDGSRTSHLARYIEMLMSTTETTNMEKKVAFMKSLQENGSSGTNSTVTLPSRDSLDYRCQDRNNKVEVPNKVLGISYSQNVLDYLQLPSKETLDMLLNNHKTKTSLEESDKATTSNCEILYNNDHRYLSDSDYCLECTPRLSNMHTESHESEHDSSLRSFNQQGNSIYDSSAATIPKSKDSFCDANSKGNVMSKRNVFDYNHIRRAREIEITAENNLKNTEDYNSVENNPVPHVSHKRVDQALFKITNRDAVTQTDCEDLYNNTDNQHKCNEVTCESDGSTNCKENSQSTSNYSGDEQQTPCKKIQINTLKIKPRENKGRRFLPHRYAKKTALGKSVQHNKITSNAEINRNEIEKKKNIFQKILSIEFYGNEGANKSSFLGKNTEFLKKMKIPKKKPSEKVEKSTDCQSIKPHFVATSGNTEITSPVSSLYSSANKSDYNSPKQAFGKSHFTPPQKYQFQKNKRKPFSKPRSKQHQNMQIRKSGLLPLPTTLHLLRPLPPPALPGHFIHHRRFSGSVPRQFRNCSSSQNPQFTPPVYHNNPVVSDVYLHPTMNTTQHAAPNFQRERLPLQINISGLSNDPSLPFASCGKDKNMQNRKPGLLPRPSEQHPVRPFPPPVLPQHFIHPSPFPSPVLRWKLQ